MAQYEEFGNQLGDTLAALHLDQVEFAAMVNVAQSTVSGWVSGESRPRRRKIPDIAKALREPADKWARLAGYGVSRLATAEDRAHYDATDDPWLTFWGTMGNALPARDKTLLMRLAETMADNDQGGGNGDRG